MQKTENKPTVTYTGIVIGIFTGIILATVGFIGKTPYNPTIALILYFTLLAFVSVFQIIICFRDYKEDNHNRSVGSRGTLFTLILIASTLGFIFSNLRLDNKNLPPQSCQSNGGVNKELTEHSEIFHANEKSSKIICNNGTILDGYIEND